MQKNEFFIAGGLHSKRQVYFYVHTWRGILSKLKKFLEDVKYTWRHMHEILNKLKIRTI